jgi:hypothetical protein
MGPVGLLDTVQAAPRRVVLPLAVVVVLLGSLAYAASPYEAAGGLKCRGALLGGKPKERVTTGLLVGREKAVCRAAANSRLIIWGIATIAALAVVVGAVVLPAGLIEQIFVRRQ